MASEDRTIGALAPSLAAEAYGLDILDADVADHPGNGKTHVRFLAAVIITLVPVGIGHDRLPGYFIEGNGQGRCA